MLRRGGQGSEDCHALGAGDLFRSPQWRLERFEMIGLIAIVTEHLSTWTDREGVFRQKGAEMEGHAQNIICILQKPCTLLP